MVENFQDEPPNPKDVVLVLKSHLSSDDISQKPFVFLPASALQNLARLARVHGATEQNVQGD